MKIHILTHNQEVKELLQSLCQKLDKECVFHETVEPIEKAVKRLGKGDCVLYDLHLEDVLWAFERLYIACRRTNFVAVERLTNQTSLKDNQCPAGVDNYLLLPSDADRALPKVQSLLKEISQKSSAAQKKSSKKKSAAKKPVQAAVEQTITTRPSLPTIPRYVHARSEVMQVLLSEIQHSAESGQLVLLSGDDGCEFETVARELNFRANGDASPMHVIDPLNFDHQDLEAAEKSAKESGNSEYCYLGLSVDWNTKSAEELTEFIDAHGTSLDSPLKFIIGYAPDLGNFSSEAVRKLIKKLKKVAYTVEIPNMDERGPDIAPIAHSVFSTLRMAHPFLRSRSLSTSAIKFLESECNGSSTSYTRLVRVIRNTMALSQKNVITDKELRNLSDNSPTTQHLIESMADERYFKTGESQH